MTQEPGCAAALASMALAIAEHCSMLACGHIAEACRAAFSDSTATTHFKMHRTKCTEMINGVLAPYFLKKLVTDVGNQRFSLLLGMWKLQNVSIFKGLEGKKRNMALDIVGTLADILGYTRTFIFMNTSDNFLKS